MIVIVIIISLNLIHMSCTNPNCKSFEYGTQRTRTYFDTETEASAMHQTACNSEQQCMSDPSTELFHGKYHFNVTSIPRLECDDPEAFQYLKREEPAVLLNCHLADTALHWSPKYFLQNIESNNLTVYMSRNRRFLYYNKAIDKDGRYNWTPPHQRMEMNFSTFMRLVSDIKRADNGTKMYLQSDLDEAGFSSDMQDDVFLFNYPWLRNISRRLGWGGEESNLLLVGMPGVVTPAHYDIVNNLFFQVYGKKRCILFKPDHFRSLYPYPVHHPHDRQSQVNFDSPDYTKFPRFRETEGLEAIVKPGEVLFIPSYWWHYIESETKNMTISLTFWYETKDNAQQINNKESSGETESEGTNDYQKQQPSSNITDEHVRVATAAEQLELRREIEESVKEAIGDASKVGEFIKELFEDRFDHL